MRSFARNINRPGSQARKARILLVDDHPLVRQALRETLSEELDLAVCGEAEDREGALATIAACQPDLAILDLALKNSDGLELIKDIRVGYPRILMLVLSMHDESLFAQRAVHAGANGYISKQEATTRIIQAVRTVLSGEIYWTEKAAAQVASKSARPELGAMRSPSDLLSQREIQVFELIGTGASAPQIAAALRIDVSTVESYRARIKEKMRYGSGLELLQAAIRWNLAMTAR
jgi:DNA-binding NarL/FixJ family response regulator